MWAEGKGLKKGGGWFEGDEGRAQRGSSFSFLLAIPSFSQSPGPLCLPEMPHATQKGLLPLSLIKSSFGGKSASPVSFHTPGAFFSVAADPVKWLLPYLSELISLVRILQWVSLWAIEARPQGSKGWEWKSHPLDLHLTPHTAYSLESTFMCVTRYLEHSKCSSVLIIITDVWYFTYIPQFSLPAKVWDRYYHYSHLADGETKVVLLAQDHRGSASPTPSLYFYTLHGFAIVTYLTAFLNL